MKKRSITIAATAVTALAIFPAIASANADAGCDFASYTGYPAKTTTGTLTVTFNGATLYTGAQTINAPKSTVRVPISAVGTGTVIVSFNGVVIDTVPVVCPQSPPAPPEVVPPTVTPPGPPVVTQPPVVVVTPKPKPRKPKPPKKKPPIKVKPPLNCTDLAQRGAGKLWYDKYGCPWRVNLPVTG